MKKMLILLLFCCSVGIMGCSDTSKEDEKTEVNNILVDKYYLGSINYSAHVIKFDKDGVVQWIDCGLGREQDSRKKYYGVYEVNNKKLTLTLSGQEEMICVIHDDGKAITINGTEFNLTEKDDLSEKTLKEFD